MKIRDYRKYFLEKLTPLYDSMEAERFFAIALEELKGWKRSDLALNPDAQLSGGDMEKWNDVLAALETQKPIQYIFGEAHFYGLEFEVNENTLIPRPETEELVEWIISENNVKGSINIIDIGTGSGCIAIALAKNLTDASVSAIDVSEGALATAKRNAVHNKTSVNFILKDILAADELPQQYDVIVSNPPYVRNLEKEEIKENVLQYEPHLALFVDDNDPLIFYRKIALLAKKWLSPNGRLYFEINQYLGPETVQMLEDLGFTNVVLKKDMYGNDRMIGCGL
ncbi:peptide chain release factor N(5)-glutamine methyltransferase [Flavobacterium sp. DG1-102-2]|uniref:peptide chain release factor N(5)-glutamine methyltransferase n=1 Tax=Flavobacterium sp. DG1-102-2 TaxID=3081663 RepID=UPI002949ECFF|nr:peptide chain release factor N(5)-glutamine methyltransferase [Flavobacterium sp. DG1-102-2]MDV6168681.1 peptide chain release factor N(5)-glutamine methyltransferase [Flavobacterium sp. DG1-102-2]